MSLNNEPFKQLMDNQRNVLKFFVSPNQTRTIL
uniref:Uncharacterized protein n=1 Tax=Rhizophora mucronata TaxID=61149 RepID=A0A2P2NK98_RHIMU